MVWQLGSEVLNSYCNIILINELIFLIEVNLSLINHTFMEKFIYYIKKEEILFISLPSSNLPQDGTITS